MHLIKITKDALQELREIDRQREDPAYWESLVDAHCEKPPKTQRSDTDDFS